MWTTLSMKQLTQKLKNGRMQILEMPVPDFAWGSSLRLTLSPQINADEGKKEVRDKNFTGQASLDKNRVKVGDILYYKFLKKFFIKQRKEAQRDCAL